MTIIHTITINRNGHTFDLSVTDHGDIAYRINGGEYRTGDLHSCSRIGDNQPSVIFPGTVSLTVNGVDRKLGGIRITQDQYSELDNVRKQAKTSVSDAIFAQARNRENDYILSVDYSFDGGYQINVRRKSRNGDYIVEPDFIPVQLREIRRSDIHGYEQIAPKWGYNILDAITAEQCDALITENAARVAAKEEAERKAEEEYQREKAELLSQVDSWEIAEKTISDEGGKTKMYTHTFRIGGEILTYTERNVFDFGVVVNPAYSIVDGITGGIALRRNDALCWVGGDNWDSIRELTPAETVCITIINKYGKFAGHWVRM